MVKHLVFKIHTAKVIEIPDIRLPCAIPYLPHPGVVVGIGTVVVHRRPVAQRGVGHSTV